MTDSFSKEERSKIMSKIKGRNTHLEIKSKRLLRGSKLRYQPKIFGKPDFGSKKLKIAVFIDSCFWHKCPKHFRMPQSNFHYWNLKISRNLKRAKEVNKKLKKEGWKIIRIWEHDINKNPKKCLKRIGLI